MEDKNIEIGEQPQASSQTFDAEEQQEILKAEDGSPIQKFRSVEALKVAYENLEKEFTQKCQKIKELTDKLEDLDNAKNNLVDAPKYESDGWEERVKTFFASHPLAKNYVAEISEVLKSDEDVAKSKNSLQNALTKVLANKFVPYETLAEDEDFLEKYIYQNKKVSEKIINNYLDNLENQKALPLITGVSGTGTFSSPVKKPKTIKDAGKMVEAYLKN